MFFETAKSILLIVSALFPIVNPIGGSPVFLLLTQDYRKNPGNCWRGEWRTTALFC